MFAFLHARNYTYSNSQLYYYYIEFVYTTCTKFYKKQIISKLLFYFKMKTNVKKIILNCFIYKKKIV